MQKTVLTRGSKTFFFKFLIFLVSVLPSVKTKNSINTPHLPRYFDNGFAVYNNKGKLNKLCMDNFNFTLPDEEAEAEEVQLIADSLCQSASYLKVCSFEF